MHVPRHAYVHAHTHTLRKKKSVSKILKPYTTTPPNTLKNPLVWEQNTSHFPDQLMLQLLNDPINSVFWNVINTIKSLYFLYTMNISYKSLYFLYTMVQLLIVEWSYKFAFSLHNDSKVSLNTFTVFRNFLSSYFSLSNEIRPKLALDLYAKNDVKDLHQKKTITPEAAPI
jgi:hypothetical protein